MICLVVAFGFVTPNRMGFASIRPQNHLSQTLLTIPELKEKDIHPLFSVDKALATVTTTSSLSANPDASTPDESALKVFLRKKITTEVKWHYSDLKTQVNQLTDLQIAKLQQKIVGGDPSKKTLDNWSVGVEFQKNLIENLTDEEKYYQSIQQRKIEKLSKRQLIKLAAFFGIKDLDQL